MTEPIDPTTVTNVDPAKVEAIPVRFWWLKRILVVSGIVVVGLVALRMWWGWDAHRQLQAEIDMYIAAGEPIYPEDFDQEPIPDDQNAAKMLDDAVAALSLTAEQDELLALIRDDFSLVGDHTEGLQKLVEANAETLRLVCAARDAPGMDWGMRFRSPTMSGFQPLFPMLDGHRRLSKVLSVVTAYYHWVGDDEAVVSILRDAFAHGEALQCYPTLISHLVAIAIAAVHAQSIERLAPNLRVERLEVVAGETARPAGRTEVETLISDLVDAHTIKGGLAWAMLGERMLSLDFFRTMLSARGALGGITGPRLFLARAIAFPATPLFELDILHMLRYQTVLRGAPGMTYSELLATVPDTVGDESPFGSLVRPFSRIMMPSHERSVVLTYRACGMRQMAGMTLAIRLYEIDHGHRPKQLSELIPDYLTHLPRDPLGDGQATYVYRPDADPPVLYSIGSNGADDGGVLLWPRENGDVPFFLNGKRPKRIKTKTSRAPQSSQTVDDNQDTEDTEGQGEEGQSGQDQP